MSTLPRERPIRVTVLADEDDVELVDVHLELPHVAGVVADTSVDPARWHVGGPYTVVVGSDSYDMMLVTVEVETPTVTYTTGREWADSGPDVTTLRFTTRHALDEWATEWGDADEVGA